ncbi:hypothetical protein N836_13700 [Leptolyngbya sp. Heron Island J]|uniref:hypothetical protein n=1 Tax=Leptolyngbya sp. Heron Island J TaxID=1385935 RepID=UPI0003B9E6F3|nr:hypothetical protein [Leptolyngbya sp. Heron Island J]ESA35114.1 hypothetical protein N836_13700 [Leptolyngbya sp. Heron Island J]
MDSTSQSTQVIQSLRIGDLVGHRQQPDRQYEVLLTVDEQCLLAVRLLGLALWFISLRDVVPPF